MSLILVIIQPPSLDFVKYIQGKEVKVVLPCDAKRGAPHKKDGDGNGTTGEEEER